jgi:membrane protease YdiL (CAAX protease family)
MMMRLLPVKLLRWVEMIIVFVGIPLSLCWDFIPRHKIVTLWVVAALCLLILLLDESFDRSRFRFNAYSHWPQLLLRLAIIAGGLVLYTAHFEPQHIGGFLRRDPVLWGRIMLIYPLFSVLPQELVYRAFFFHRYRSLFPSERVMVLANAALFSFGHILFRNWAALAGAFIAALLWADTYRKSGSLPVVSIEHALYGSVAFTLGIGRYFYAPTF